MRTLAVEHIIHLHREIIKTSGGTLGIRDSAAIESAVAQPKMTFDGVELYPTLAAKAAALAHSLISGHPFIDGNKRIGHAAMETMLVLNGMEISVGVDEQERTILGVAAGTFGRDEFIDWVESNVRQLSSERSPD